MARDAASEPDPVDILVGDNVRSRRRRRGLSQAGLGALVGVTFQQIKKYERRINRISASMLVRIAEALSVAPATLLPPRDDQGIAGAQDQGLAALLQAWPRLLTYERHDVVRLVLAIAQKRSDPNPNRD